MGTKIEDFSIPCFPTDETLMPPPEELEAIYHQIEAGNIPKLQWRGVRRLPSPVTTQDTPEDAPEKETPTKNKDFDFMDEASVTTAPMSHLRVGTAKNAKRKTANFAVIIDSMKKHGRLSTPTTSSPAKDSS